MERETGLEPATVPMEIGKLYRLDYFDNYLERETGLEPATACLEGRNSTN
jgi:hypothetical protein